MKLKFPSCICILAGVALGCSAIVSASAQGAAATSSRAAVEKPPILVAFEKLKAGDFLSARRLVEPLAEAGDRDARHMLAYMEERGLGGPKDLRRAIELYAAAANAGSADAQFALGELAFLGDEVEQNYPRAVSWFELAAAQGHLEAKVRLGMMYAEGLGVAADQTRATDYFRQAAEAGDAGAQYNMGVAYLVGRGAPRNYDKAAGWFEKAADQAHADAQYNLALLYESDYLGPPNPALTVRWMKAAAENKLPAAFVAMGLMTHDGRVGAEPNRDAATSAADWFEKAARAGDPQGQFLFAVALAKGDGREVNPEAAVTWLDAALAARADLLPETRANAEQLRAELAEGKSTARGFRR